VTGDRALLLFAGLAGFSGVALAAIGAHAFPLESTSDRQAWQSAMLIHLVHAAVLLALAACAHRSGGARWAFGSGLLMLVGIVLFSGSIVLRLSTGLQLPFVAPTGGICLLLAWSWLMVAAVRSNSDGNP
jgi:uncharacterized membrane protein YgdD (TMEM256/DUF423 family)